MSHPSAFADAARYQPVECCDYRGVTLPLRFDDLAAEYAAAADRVAVFDRGDRGLVIATGADRLSWLHNLVTNAVKTLDTGAGNYAFATDVKGRVQFDLNILNRPDALWLDIDAATVPAALAHLERRLITEDVRLEDATTPFARLACAGPDADAVAVRLGVANFAALPALASVTLADGAVFVRHDFTVQPGFELIVARSAAAAWWDRLVGDCGATPAGFATLDVLRLEAGLPWWGRDIDEDVLPPETGQIERGISYHKGCYLGQEVIERMRSRGVIARRLARLTAPDAAGLAVPAPLTHDNREVGRVTSLARHPQRGDWLGLGYVRSGLAAGTAVTAGAVTLNIAD